MPIWQISSANNRNKPTIKQTFAANWSHLPAMQRDFLRLMRDVKVNAQLHVSLMILIRYIGSVVE
jgi:hypothetical protein